MWKLVEFIIILVAELVFIMFNRSNSCDISLGFVQFSDVPIYVTSLVAFVLGLFAAVPFLIFSHFKRQEKRKGKVPEEKTAAPPHDQTPLENGRDEAL